MFCPRGDKQLVNAIIGAMTGAIVGIVAFVVIKNIVSGQDTSGWSGAERAVIDVIPIAIGVLVLVGVFTSLQMRR